MCFFLVCFLWFKNKEARARVKVWKKPSCDQTYNLFTCPFCFYSWIQGIHKERSSMIQNCFYNPECLKLLFLQTYTNYKKHFTNRCPLKMSPQPMNSDPLSQPSPPFKPTHPTPCPHKKNSLRVTYFSAEIITILTKTLTQKILSH